MDMIVNPKELTKELAKAKLPVAGVSSTGRVDYTRKLTKTEASAADAIIKAHDPQPTDAEIEAGLIAGAGVTIRDMVMALWVQAVIGDRGALDALADKIDAVRSRA